MSRIFLYWKCEHCGDEFKQYVSFGHPSEDFEFTWKCDKCGGINKLLVEAMPYF